MLQLCLVVIYCFFIIFEAEKYVFMGCMGAKWKCMVCMRGACIEGCTAFAAMLMLLNSCGGSVVTEAEKSDERDDGMTMCRDSMNINKPVLATYCGLDSVMICDESFFISDFEKYQTFDEFKMRGEGKPVKCPFVYVLQSDDRTYVSVSDDTTKVRKYYKICDRWFTCEEYDLWKKEYDLWKDDGIGARSRNENPARVYYRILGNDSILELRCSYVGDFVLNDLYIKAVGKCIWITHWPSKTNKLVVKPSVVYFGELRKLVDLFNKGETFLQSYIVRKYGFRPGVYVYSYRLRETPVAYIYECGLLKERLYFTKNSLGLFGVQPGFDKFDEEKSVVH